MSRVIQCFKMLKELSTHQILNQRQLAELLETNPRNIREYRKELCLAGIPVEEKRGRNGGYYLPGSFRFSQPQKQAVEIPFEKELEEAIQKRKKIQLKYQSLSHNQPINLKVDPIALIHYEKQPYLVAFSHLKNDYELFILNEGSIQDLKILDQGFHTPRIFSLEDFIATSPVFHGKVQKYRVRLTPIQESLFLKEKWGDAIKKEGKEEECVIYTFYSDREDDLIQKAINHQVLLLEPEQTRQKIVKDLQKLSAMYLET